MDMSKLLIKNARIFDGKNFIKPGCILVEDGKIIRLCERLDDFEGDIIDAGDCIAAPGFIDIHIHGAFGYDTMDADLGSIYGMAKKISEHGITSFTPTTITARNKDIQASLSVIRQFIQENRDDCAEVLGVHLEGPFINPVKKAAMNPDYIQAASVDNYLNLIGEYKDIVKAVTIAPETEGALELTAFLGKSGVNISLGHSCANFEEVGNAIKAGVTRATHVFNAMTGLHHREPGTAGGVLFSDDISCEIIADLIHVHYSVLKMIVKLKGSDRCILVSDSMMAAGLKDGDYNLGDVKVTVRNGIPRLADGNLAGSTLTLDRAIKNMVEKVNIPLEEALKMATYNPARLIGVGKEKGRILEGYDADIAILDRELDVNAVIKKGRLLSKG
jgi:N-acetylglucosamine-6-phosphate deacetylase